MATIRFSHIHIGDVFLDKSGIMFQAIALEKTGCCSGKSNARVVGSLEKAYFAPMRHVTLVTKYRTHPDNLEALQEYLPKPAFVEADETMYKEAFWNSYVRPTVAHRFIEYESTDTWLIHFGWGEKTHKRHYQKFNGTGWDGYEF